MAFKLRWLLLGTGSRFYLLVAGLLAFGSVAMALTFSTPRPGQIEGETRESIADYAKANHLSLTQARQEFAATGRIECPFDASSAFLVYQNDIVITARHVLFSRMPGRYISHGAINRCAFETSDGKTSVWHMVDVKSITYPDLATGTFFDNTDWAIMKLQKPIDGITPYRLPELPAKAGEKILDVTTRQANFPKEDWNERLVSQCAIRDVESFKDAPAGGLKLDCAMSGGASGSPILRKSAKGWTALGLASAGKANCRGYDRAKCFNFAVGLYPGLQAAIKKLAATP
ncbi:MAG: trypsin-like peptidase domain-containing protein [Hyphomicrobiales bacterium]|nr:trypsin-like peptidase domain-containing protein [Hyphomicrobiales bacterium]MDE2116131.1 trypsin-like peptidase domain-containing protein [Hyphomicrobiales bacterium]